MTVRTKLLVGAGALALGYYLYKKKRIRPPCAAGSTWKVTSDPTGYSPAVAESIRTFGGYCAQQGFVDDVFDSGLITQPWQVP